MSRLRQRARGSTIVYVTLQRTAEAVAALLGAAGFDAEAYHAGMDSEARNAVQNAFMQSDHKIIVATIAFGMGIDKSDIRYVYHYNLPKGLENYAQEIGRAGRDGRESICELLACPDDVVVLDNFAYGDTPTPTAVDGLISHLLGRGPAFDVSVYELSHAYDVRPLVVETLLTYLELEGVLQATGPFYSEFKFQPTKPSREILARFDASRADFLRKIFQRAVKGITWFRVDVSAIGRELGESRERIVAALNYLEESGDLLLQATGLRQGYRLLSKPPDCGALARMLGSRFQKREDNDVGRIHRALRYAQEPGCLTRHLLAYFGEELGPCGHCVRCEGQAAEPLPPPNYTAPGSTEARALGQLRMERHPALATPRQTARFLCGVSSPATSQAKLRSHAMFGSLDSVPFREVLAFVEKHWNQANP